MAFSPGSLLFSALLLCIRMPVIGFRDHPNYRITYLKTLNYIYKDPIFPAYHSHGVGRVGLEHIFLRVTILPTTCIKGIELPALLITPIGEYLGFPCFDR